MKTDNTTIALKVKRAFTPWLTLFCILSNLLVGISAASAGAWDTLRHRSGWVLTRGLVYSDNGKIIYSHYNDAGETVGDIGVAEGPLEGAKVMAADEYRQIVDYFNNFKNEHRDGIAKGARVMTAQAYNDAEFTTVSGQAVTKTPLLPGSKSVLVKSSQQLLISDNTPLLLQATIDLSDARNLGGGTKSVLLDKDGKVHTTSSNTIGPKTISHDDERLSVGQAVAGAVKGQGVEVYAPIGGGAITDENGFFSALYFMNPCPGFSYWMPSATLIEYPFQHFDAEGDRVIFYPALYMTSSDFCSGYGEQFLGANLLALMTQVAIKGIEASISTPSYLYQFYLDINIVNGKGYFSNGVERIPLGETAYEYQAPDDSTIVQTEYDFDGDDVSENAVLGKVVADADGEDKFTICNVTDDQKKYQGIYLSGGGKQPNFACGTADELADSSQPDFIRLADKATDFQHQGLLKSISEADFVDTDLYVFRQSNGMLITERQGLKYSEISGFDRGGVRDGEMFYQMVIRGGNSNNGFNFEDTQKLGFSGFQSAMQMNPALHQRKADHLRPHEKIRIVAINRKTGYMGTTSALYGLNNANGMISFPIGDIKMGPPNLKVKAERQYDVDRGLSKNEQKDYLIGYEGASLTSDTIVKITTEWFDADGSPLPKGLESLGFTGRLAKVVATNALAAEGGQLAQFAIKPGYHVEQVKLGGFDSEHYYVQVSPEKKSGNPSFGGNANGPGPLKYRPQNYVPIKVPLMDETLSWQQFRAYQKLKREGQADNIPKPDPIYRWYYRPEMQFSMYDLNIKNIFREDAEGQSVDIYPQDKPAISSSDDMVKIAYNIVEQSAAALQYLGAGQQLTFAIGEHEIEAVVGDDQQIQFTNLAHLASLESDDFLTMRLYSNNDPGNILWEFGFDYIALDTLEIGKRYEDDDYYYVSADDPIIDFQAMIPGYVYRQKKETVVVSFVPEGAATVSVARQSDKDQGVFNTTLTMNTTAGSEAVLSAVLDSSNTKAIFKTIKVLPGKPASIALVADGNEVSAMGIDSISFVATITDQYGNAVADGTTPAIVKTGDFLVEEVSTGGSVDGVYRFKVTGSEINNPNNSLTVSTYNASQSYSFKVNPLTVTFGPMPTSQFVGESGSVVVTVTDDSGNAVSGVNVSAFSSYGIIVQNELETNNAGEVEIKFINPPSHGDAKLKAMVGLAGSASLNYTVGYHSGSNNAGLDSLNGMLIGDTDADGLVGYERFDGTRIGMDFKTSTQVMVKGNAGEVVGVSLGDQSNPNIEPVAAYYMNWSDERSVANTVVAEDEVGLHHGQLTNVSVAKSNLNKVGYSYYFDKTRKDDRDIVVGSQLYIPDDSAFRLSQDVGFRVEINPAETGGILVNHLDVQRLVLADDGRLKYTIVTDNGSYDVYSDVIPLNQWQTVVGRYHQGKMELMVDGQTYTTANVSGNLLYGAPDDSSGLYLGQNYTGLLNDFRWYDWTAESLLALPNGASQMDVTIGDNGETLVEIFSKGNLNSGQTDSQLKILPVTVQSNGLSAQVSVMSQPAYAEVASLYIDTLYKDAPPLKLSGLTFEDTAGGLYASRSSTDLSGRKFFFIEDAQAFDIDISLSDIWDATVATVNFLVPYQDFGILIDQIGYLVTGSDEFDATKLSFAALGVATVIPLAKPLKPLLKPIQRFITKYGDKPVIRALAGVLGSAVKQAVKQRKLTKLLKLAPFLMIVGEIATSPDALEALEAFVKTVDSTDDLWAWIDYFNLPAVSWEGEGIPEVAISASGGSNSLVNHVQGVPVAYAAGKATLLRVLGARMAKTIVAFANRNGGKYMQKSKNIPKMLKEVNKAAKKVSAGGLRAHFFDGSFLVSSAALARVGVGALKGFLQGRTDDRVSQVVLFGTVAYIENALFEEYIPKIEPVTARSNEYELYGLYAKAFVGFANARHGARFHLVMVAYAVAMNRFEGGLPVTGIETVRPVNYYASIFDRGKDKKLGESYNRTVDILLGPPNEQIWMEIKSLRAPKKGGEKAFLRNFAAKSLSAPKSPYHRQFFADRVASEQDAEGNKYFEWWFQDFKGKQKKPNPAINGLGANELNKFKIRNLLCAKPQSTSDQAIEGSLNLMHGQIKNATKLCETQAKLRVLPFSAVSVGLKLLEHKILENVTVSEL